MTNITSGSLVLQAATWPSRHSRVVSFGWGLFSGCTFGPLIVGSAVVGYLIGRSGGGRRNLAVASVGMLAGFAVTMTFLVTSMVKAGCPSCADALIVAPGTFLFLLGPLAFGYWLSRRSARRAAERAVAQGEDIVENHRTVRAQSDWRGAGWLSGALAVPFGILGVLLGASTRMPLAIGLFVPSAIVLSRVVGTDVGLRGRRAWLLATTFCLGFGWLVMAFVLQFWAAAGCPGLDRSC